MRAYLFPGQGSQFKGMGRALFSAFPTVVQQANEILGYSIQTLCMEDPSQQLNLTQFTQPALYIVNHLHYLNKNAYQSSPDFICGHSLGEYNALTAANVFDFKTGLRLVKKRADLMSKVSGGGMAAVIGIDEDTLNVFLNKHGLNTLQIANYNHPTQFVISGTQESLQTAFPLFTQASINIIPLKVSGAFHCALMQPIAAEFATFLQTFTFAIPTFPVLANVDAKPYHPNITATYLANQLTAPVQWIHTIKTLSKKGVADFEEIGPGNVLTKLVQQILARLTT